MAEWQTRTTQNRVRLKPRVSSTLSLGTDFYMSPEFNPNTLQALIITKLSKAVINSDEAIDTMKLEDTPDSINYAQVKTDNLLLLVEQAKLIGIPRYNILKTMVGATKENERKTAIEFLCASNGGISDETIKRLCKDFDVNLGL